MIAVSCHGLPVQSYMAGFRARTLGLGLPSTLDKVITVLPISTRKQISEPCFLTKTTLIYKVPFDRIIPQTLRERALNLLNARIRTYSGNVP